ncbi:MAG: AraC family transcriptional regulator, partial [Clostridiales bacterium]|nr:AraC family transcriptional regulator [Clostridiales bacterium]
SEQFKEKIHHHGPHRPQKGNIRITPENQYIGVSDDIALNKHPFYIPCDVHAHDFFEVVYVYRGSFDQYLDGKDVRMQAGDLCILSPGVPHLLKVFDESIAINLLIRRSTFQEAFFGLLKGKDVFAEFFSRVLYTENYLNYLMVHTGDDAKIRELVLELMLEYLNQESYCRQILHLKVSELFAYCLRYHEKDIECAAQHNTHRMTEILAYIQQHYDTVTLYSLAEHFHFNPNYLSRQIKECTGSTFIHIIKTIRMNRAAELLTGTPMKVAQIAEVLGYENAAYFTRAFQSVYGMSPRDYRVQKQEKS